MLCLYATDERRDVLWKPSGMRCLYHSSFSNEYTSYDCEIPNDDSSSAIINSIYCTPHLPSTVYTSLYYTYTCKHEIRVSKCFLLTKATQKWWAGLISTVITQQYHRIKRWVCRISASDLQLLSGTYHCIVMNVFNCQLYIIKSYS